MPRNRQKSEFCLNCDFPLRPEDNYCPNCGQENNIKNVPARYLIVELFEGFYSFDTKLWNTIKASFLKPGRITLEYLEGKRARYVPPLKFYLFISFIFFLLLGKLSDNAIDSSNINSNILTDDDLGTMNLSISELLGNKKTYYSKDSTDISSVDFDFRSKDSLLQVLTNLQTAHDTVLNKLLLQEDIDTNAITRENFRKALALIPLKNAALDSIKPKYEVYNNIKFDTKEEYLAFKKDVPNYNNEQLDSVLTKFGNDANWFNRQMLKKMAIYDFKSKDSIKQITQAILKSISLTMFIMMPLTAILLLLIFYRKKYYYEHLIFSIHQHTIFFFFFSIILAIQIYISESFGEKLWGWSFLLCIGYLIISLKNNYKQSWGKTIAKFILMSIPYGIIAFILTLIAVVYGFLA
ncbi:hypothetical protein CYCD_02500 [Tenuifilaceae bacterium CYCD]|nr:hypothetical protein CYCD_02500 [Tenuifilaceae bacterium CYCD]